MASHSQHSETLYVAIEARLETPEFPLHVVQQTAFVFSPNSLLNLA